MKKEIAAGLMLVCLSLTANANSPAITKISMSGGYPRLNIQSDLGVTNQIQTSTNLSQSNWLAVTNVLVVQSPYSFVDSISPAGSQRYYRIVVLPTNSASVPAGMMLIPAGTFQMGDSFGEGEANELPVHTVTVSAYYMDKFEVTKGLWDSVVAWSAAHGYGYDYPASGKATNHPINTLDWYDMAKWCNARSEREGRVPAYYTDAGLTQIYRAGQAAPFVNWNAGYRLPTEAEWERAARGGAAGHRFPWTSTDLITHSNANYYSDPSFAFDVSPTRGFNPAFADGTSPYTSPVGSFAPNAYGLYDMAGNVWEWCWDWAADYPSAAQTNPRGPATGDSRVGRGGNWNYYASHLRNSYRFGNSPNYSASNIGFRCAMTAN
jgi:formylglycine-generating enzyme required for sulfatase activity